MPVADRFRERLSEAFEDWTGKTVVDSASYGSLVTKERLYEDLASEAEDLAHWVMQGGYGLSSDPTPDRRHRVAKRMRVAWANDPMAFTEAEHYANFTLGRGVSPPQCEDPEVQKVVDAAWKANRRQLTSLDALRAISNELRSGANVYPIFYRGNGTVRVGFANADDVVAVRPSDENRLEALWYVVRHVERKWDYDNDTWAISAATTGATGTQVRYFPVLYAAAEDAAREDGKSTPPPPSAKLGDGEIFHLRLSRPLEGAFGVPHWQRSLPFFSALRRLTEARVEMQLAASSIIAKRVVRGGQSDVAKAAGNVMNQLGEIAAASERHPNAQRARPSGRTTLENDADRLEAVSLNSGAGQAQTDLSIVRGAAIAPSAMGQHYFGAGDDTSLASASCHDETTETLTEEGWLDLDALIARDREGTLPKIASFDKTTGVMRYEEAIDGLKLYDYAGPMIEFRNRRTDLLVTPNHRMWVQRSEEWAMVEARDVRSRKTQKRAAPFEGGTRIDEVVIPEYVAVQHYGARCRYTEEQAAQVRALYAERSTESRPGFCRCGCGARTPIARVDRQHRVVGEENPVVACACGCGAEFERFNAQGAPRAFLPGHNKGHLRRAEIPRRLVHHRFLPGHANRPLNGRARIAETTGLTRAAVDEILFGPRGRRGSGPRRWPEARVPADAFLYWLGWYIAEGSDAQIAQKANSPWIEKVRAACAALGVDGREVVKPTPDGAGMYFWTPRAAKQWQTFLDAEVGRGFASKRVPSWVFDLPRDQQMLVLRGIVEGDGTTCGRSTWETVGSVGVGVTNDGLLDDIQRLGLHCGFRADRVAQPINPRSSIPVSGYISLVATGEDTPRGCNGSRAVLPPGRTRMYQGRVYCFQTPSDTLITRRGGRVAFHGNTMELPAAMAVGGYSQLFEDLLRTFTDVAIEEAVRAGTLGGVVRPPDGLPLSELRLNEEDDLAEAQQRTGRDLSYTFEMPYPGRRNLPDIVGVFNALMLPWPQGENEEGFELALQVLLGQGLNMENAPKLAKAIAARQQKLIKDAQDAQQQAMAPPPGAGADQGQLDQYLAGQQGLANPADGTSASQDVRNNDRPDTSRPAYGEKRQAATATGDVGQYQSLVESAMREGAYPDGVALANALGGILERRLLGPVNAGRNGHG